MQCREATPADENLIVTFQLAMAWETEGLKLDLETCTRGVNAVFKNPQYGKYFVAEKLGQVVGSLLIIPEWSDWRNAVVWWIHSVYIIPSERKNGIFSILYRFIQERSLVDGVRGLRLYVDHRNHHAQAVYKHLGMTDEHYSMFEWMRN